MLLYILSKNKLTETFFVHEHFRIRRCFNSFSSIRFLICVGKLPFARVPSYDSLPILPYPFCFVKRFSLLFKSFFKKFLPLFQLSDTLGCPRLICLPIIPLY